jgi:enoyl-CoA hydratase/carnithine racemase
MGDAKHIQIMVSNGIMTLRINRPDKKNALSLAMYQTLADGLREADRDDAVRVIVICGGTDCFTSGNDLADFLGAPPTGPESPVMQFLLAISETRKPVIAAVNGLAVGVGVTMLLHC